MSRWPTRSHSWVRFSRWIEAVSVVDCVEMDLLHRSRLCCCGGVMLLTALLYWHCLWTSGGPPVVGQKLLENGGIWYHPLLSLRPELSSQSTVNSNSKLSTGALISFCLVTLCLVTLIFLFRLDGEVELQFFTEELTQFFCGADQLSTLSVFCGSVFTPSMDTVVDTFAKELTGFTLSPADRRRSNTSLRWYRCSWNVRMNMHQYRQDMNSITNLSITRWKVLGPNGIILNW